MSFKEESPCILKDRQKQSVLLRGYKKAPYIALFKKVEVIKLIKYTTTLLKISHCSKTRREEVK